MGRQTKEWSDERTEEREKTTGVNGERERKRERKEERERGYSAARKPERVSRLVNKYKTLADDRNGKVGVTDSRPSQETKNNQRASFDGDK